MLPIRTILHPTDLSDCSRHAGELAANLAKDRDAQLVLLHIIEPSEISSELGVALSDPRSLRAAVDGELVELQRSYNGVHCEHVVAMGSPAAEIVRVAGEIKSDLIVLGTHGRRGLGRLLMGSVAEEVIRRAPCPVLTLKPTDSQHWINYEDWISAVMAAPDGREPRGEKGVRPENFMRAANAGYAATVEQTVRTTNRWLRDVRLYLGEEQTPQAFRLMRTVLHVLRDHLSVNQVASLGAQLPLLLRGILYEGWDPTGKPEKNRRLVDFVGEVKYQMFPEPLDHPERAVHAVLAALSKHLTAGEVAKLKRALPHEIRELWEVRRTKPDLVK
jgi:nucleotide-binding universal stress UspA family protein/uncharacterized protein (DUF2267 family)